MTTRPVIEPYGVVDALDTIANLLVISNSTQSMLFNVVDVQFSTAIQLQRDMLAKLNDILTKLNHVEVDSYVNVRIVDELGALALPATIATGLLVSAVVSGPVPITSTGTLSVNVVNTPDVVISGVPSVNVANVPIAVNVTNTPNVAVVGTVDVAGTVDAQTRLYDSHNDTWDRALGWKVAHTTHQEGGGVGKVTDSIPGLVAINAIGGSDLSLSSTLSMATTANALVGVGTAIDVKSV